MNREFLTWTVGEQIYGLELDRCKEVEKSLHLTPVPGAKSHIAGVVNLRGDVVTIIDLNELLRHKTVERPERMQIIRLKSASTQIALIADKIEDILSIPEENLEPAGAHMDEGEAFFIRYVAITKRGTVLILNSDRILAGKA